MFAESDVDGEEADSDYDAQPGDRAQYHVDRDVDSYELFLDHTAVSWRPTSCRETQSRQGSKGGKLKTRGERKQCKMIADRRMR